MKFDKQYHILVVEDNTTNQMLLGRLLDNWGGQYMKASNGIEALNLLKTTDNRFDLILMDIQMPEMNGIECTKHIRSDINSKYHSVPIIGITASVGINLREQFVTQGFTDYIAKPFNAKELYTAIIHSIQVSGQYEKHSDSSTFNHYQYHISRSNDLSLINLAMLNEHADSNEDFFNELVNQILKAAPGDTEFLRTEVSLAHWIDSSNMAYKLKSSVLLLQNETLISELDQFIDLCNNPLSFYEMVIRYNEIANQVQFSLKELYPSFNPSRINLIDLDDISTDSHHVLHGETLSNTSAQPINGNALVTQLNGSQASKEIGIEINGTVKVPEHPRILVIDDDQAIVKIIAFRLEKMGYQVTTAYDGKEAIDRINDTTFDLILTDLMLPFYNGMELVSYVRKNKQSSIPIIILSAVEFEETVLEAFKMGATDFLNKPFSPNELLARLQKHLK